MRRTTAEMIRTKLFSTYTERFQRHHDPYDGMLVSHAPQSSVLVAPLRNLKTNQQSNDGGDHSLVIFPTSLSIRRRARRASQSFYSEVSDRPQLTPSLTKMEVSVHRFIERDAEMTGSDSTTASPIR
ncbi:hypothetical protein HWV62_33915 [Athelia sp. TMB]|nr:hypothetical protein HWV62_33915 [Athelia sp. TMB]